MEKLTNVARSVRWLSPSSVKAWVESSGDLEARRTWVLKYVYLLKTFVQTIPMKKGESFDYRIKCKIRDVLTGWGVPSNDGTFGAVPLIDEPFTDVYMNSGAWEETFRLCTGCTSYGLGSTQRYMRSHVALDRGIDPVTLEYARTQFVPVFMKPDWWWMDADGLLYVLDWKTKGSGSASATSPTGGYYVYYKGKVASGYKGSKTTCAVDDNYTQIAAYMAGFGRAAGVGVIVEVTPQGVSFHKKNVETRGTVQLFTDIWKITDSGHYFDWLSRDESDKEMANTDANIDLYSMILCKP